MKPGTVLAAGAALVVAVSGSACLTPDQLSTMQTDITNMRAQMDALSKQSDATAASVAAMKQSLATRDDGGRAASAEFNRQVQAIRDDIHALGSRLDELQHRLSGLSDAAPGGAPRMAPSGSVQPWPSGGEDSGASGDRPAGEPARGLPAGGAGAAADDLFNGAYADYSKGNYAPAILGFQDYLQRYPRSDKADDALYWIGLCHYDQGQYAEAIAAFDRILQEYPDGDKPAGAQLKKGLSLLEMSKTAQGVVQLQAVTEHYPRSEEARIARDRLTELGVKP